ncbi:MAG: ABC transporter permease [Halobacteria archaeon]
MIEMDGLLLFYWKRFKRSKAALISLGFLIFLILTGILGPLFTCDPARIDFQKKELPPLGCSIEHFRYNPETKQIERIILSGNWEHPLGTDDKGRDMLAMLISGTRVSLFVGLLATALAILTGTLIGVASAYYGGMIDNLMMRITDVMMTFPFFILLVLMVFIFGQSLGLIILIIGLTGWTGTARMIRSEVLSLRNRDFILALKVLGASEKRIIFRHLLPNVASLIIVIATLSIPGVILAESGLSFIGLGDPNIFSWGKMLQDGQRTLTTAWWMAVEPGVMLFLTVLAFNFLGDGLRDALDPRALMR